MPLINFIYMKLACAKIGSHKYQWMFAKTEHGKGEGGGGTTPKQEWER